MSSERKIELFPPQSPERILALVLPVTERYFAVGSQECSYLEAVFTLKSMSRDSTRVEASLWKQLPGLYGTIRLEKDGSEASDISITTDRGPRLVVIPPDVYVGNQEQLARWFTSTVMALQDGMTPNAIKFAAEVSPYDPSVQRTRKAFIKNIPMSNIGEATYDAYLKYLAENRFRV